MFEITMTLIMSGHTSAVSTAQRCILNKVGSSTSAISNNKKALFTLGSFSFLRFEYDSLEFVFG